MNRTQNRLIQCIIAKFRSKMNGEKPHNTKWENDLSQFDNGLFCKQIQNLIHSWSLSVGEDKRACKQWRAAQRLASIYAPPACVLAN